MGRRSGYAVALALISVGFSLVPHGAAAGIQHRAAPASAPVPASLAQVRYIYRGLTVRPPKKHPAKARVKQKLFSKYFLRTRVRQKASLRFNDGTILHINQLTDLTLASPHVTQVKRGEVDEILRPGTNHQVAAGSAVATAIGTQFDVRVTHKHKKAVTRVIVVEGVVQLTGSGSSVLVHAGQVSTVVQGKPPTAPRSINVAAALSWTKSIPAPATPVGENVALDANGGRVVAYSSQAGIPSARARPQQTSGSWPATQINDGNLTTGWSSAPGRTSNEWVKFGFGSGNGYRISSVIIDPAATGGHSDANDLRDFEIRASSGGMNDSDFQTVLTATAQQSATLQEFTLPQPVTARYLELLVQSNYGGNAVDVAEFEAVTKANPVVLPTLTPTPPATATPIPTNTPVSMTYSMDIRAGYYDSDAGDTPNVPTTEELYIYEIKGSTCGPTPFSQPWNMSQIIQTNDDGRNLNDSIPFTLSFTPGQDASVPGGYFPTTLNIANTFSTTVHVDMQTEGFNPPELVGDQPITINPGCSTPSTRMARNLSFSTNPVSRWQAASQALHRLDQGTMKPIRNLRRERARLLARERHLAVLWSQGRAVSAELRATRARISKLDEDIAEYGTFVRHLRGAEQRTERRLRHMLDRSLYGTWVKARR